MTVFDIGTSNKPVKVWGPTVSVKVKMGDTGDLGSSGWFLTGMQIGAQEIVDVRQCFNDVSYIYALGNDQSKCAISMSFMVFIGTKECKGNDNLKALKYGINLYKKKRISQDKSPRTLTIGGFSTKGWLIGLDFGQVDAETGVCHGTFEFIMQLEA